jgi:hypothetical protein
MRTLSSKEIEAVHGSAGPFAGGILGGGVYLAINGMTGQQITLEGFAGSVATGAVTGGYSALVNGAKGMKALTGVAKFSNDAHAAGLGALSGAGTYGVVSNLDDDGDGGS